MARSLDNQSTSRERVAVRRRNKAATPRARKRTSPASRTIMARVAERFRTPERPKSQRHARQATVAATPGPRRVAVSWLASGRVASALVLLGSLLGLIYLFTNVRFTVQDVRVSGADVLNERDVIELADTLDTSIWYVDAAAIRERLKANAYIEEASVSVALPNQVLISVAERRPEIRWSSAGQHFFVDASGRVLGVAESSSTITNSLIIEDRSGVQLEPNSTVDSDALHLGSALALRLTPETGVRPISIEWSGERGISVIAPDNKTIIFGKSERLDEKLIVLDTLLKQGTPWTFLDLRPKTPYYRNEADTDS